jgi:hypothetical protein
VLIHSDYKKKRKEKRKRRKKKKKKKENNKSQDPEVNYIGKFALQQN